MTSLNARPLSLDQLAALGNPSDLLRRLIQSLTGRGPLATAAPDPIDPNEPHEPRGVREGGAQDALMTRRPAMKNVFAILFALASLTALTVPAPAIQPGPASGTRALRSPIDGPRNFRGDIQAYSRGEVSVVLRAGEPTLITMQGDGDTDVDLYVYDENGILIASDTGASDQGHVWVTPRWTGRFTIVVRNLGGIFNHVVLTAR